MRALTPIDDSLEPLAFRAVATGAGRVLAARGRDGSLYCHGRVAPGSPLCSWRETPSGDRQWLAFDVADQASGTRACRRAAASSARGDVLVVTDWPIRAASGIATDRRTPVRVTRDARGLAFEPVAEGAPAVRVAARDIAEFLSGAGHWRIPESGEDAGLSRVRMLRAARDAAGALSPAERLRAGATMALRACPAREGSRERKLVESTLGRLCAALCPMLDRHAPRRAILDVAAGAVSLLEAAPARSFPPVARAWLQGEAKPALAVLDARMAAHEEEQAALEWAPAPAFA